MPDLVVARRPRDRLIAASFVSLRHLQQPFSKNRLLPPTIPLARFRHFESTDQITGHYIPPHPLSSLLIDPTFLAKIDLGAFLTNDTVCVRVFSVKLIREVSRKKGSSKMHCWDNLINLDLYFYRFIELWLDKNLLEKRKHLYTCYFVIKITLYARAYI